MLRKEPPIALAVLTLGAVGTLFTLSITGDVPGLWGLAAIATLPLSGLLLATWATEARRS
jgi:hypothetical protein